MLAATVSGVAHRLKGHPGDDAYAWELGPPGDYAVPDRLAIAVADGLGSAARGGEAALLASAKAVADAVEARGPVEDACRAGLRAATDLLSVRAAKEPAAELATTLVLAVMTPAREGAGLEVACARTGDSSAFVVAEDAQWREVQFMPPAGDGVAAQDDDILDTRTRALGVPGAQDGEEMSATFVVGASESLALLSDGVWRPLLDGPSTVAPALAAVVTAAREGLLGPVGWADAIGFSRRGAHDDRAAVVVWPLVAARGRTVGSPP